MAEYDSTLYDTSPPTPDLPHVLWQRGIQRTGSDSTPDGPLTVQTHRTNEWGKRRWPPRTPAVVSSGENLVAATEATHGLEAARIQAGGRVRWVIPKMLRSVGLGLGE